MQHEASMAMLAAAVAKDGRNAPVPDESPEGAPAEKPAADPATEYCGTEREQEPVIVHETHFMVRRGASQLDLYLASAYPSEDVVAAFFTARICVSTEPTPDGKGERHIHINMPDQQPGRPPQRVPIPMLEEGERGDPAAWVRAAFKIADAVIDEKHVAVHNAIRQARAQASGIVTSSAKPSMLNREQRRALKGH